MSEVFIRLATGNDAALIAAISRETFYSTFALQNTAEDMEKFMNEQFSSSKLMAQVMIPDNIFLLAYVNEEVCGYVRMLDNSEPATLKEKPSIEIARIYARENAIGKGVGSALMQRCIDIAKEKKKKSIWLGVWERNARAISFYEKWGFEKFGEHDFVLGSDVQRDWMMRKVLE